MKRTKSKTHLRQAEFIKYLYEKETNPKDKKELLALYIREVKKAYALSGLGRHKFI